MNLSHRFRRAAAALPGAFRAFSFILALGFGTAVASASYQGPVPAPTDAFGGPGTYTVAVDTLPSPDWPGHVVTVYHPVSATGPLPAWFFAHGFAGTDPNYYGELLQHLASHGAFVVFSPYPAELLQVDSNYATLFDGFVAAVQQYGGQIDTTRVGFAGHSYGGGAVPALALRAVRERGWGSNGLALLLLAPWYSYHVTDSDLASFPAGTQAIVQIYEDDTMNDHRMAIDIFNHLNLTTDAKDFLMLRSDRIAGYNYVANHTAPVTGTTPRGGTFDALDAWGVLRIAQALAASTWQHDPTAQAIAFGHGSAAQTQMGTTSDGRALRPMAESGSPAPLFPCGRYIQPWNGLLNPRYDEPLPQPAQRTHLANLSARARSAGGDDVMIVGAVIDGTRPKSLLVRAVGPTLIHFGITDPMPNPQLFAYRASNVDLSLDDWAQTPDLDALAAATAETGAFPLDSGSHDAAILASYSPGTLTVQAPASDGTSGIALLEFYDADDDTTSRLINLSARARVGTGEDMLMAGFVISGTDSLRLLVRGIGPGLAGLGITAPLTDPVLEIFRGNERIAVNDNWSSDPTQAQDIAATATQVGAFPLANGSTDSSLLVTLPPGIYSAHVSSANGQSGIGLVEIYEVP